MRFSKPTNIYEIIRTTGSQDNILSISFNKDYIEVVKWNLNNIDKSRIRTSKEKVLEQVLSGLESVNQSIGTNYKLYKIYFSPFDISTNRIYSGLIAALIRHYHSRNEFKEVELLNF